MRRPRILSASADSSRVAGIVLRFPWCAVSFGRSAGCCDGKGGYELCLEQHITPDVGFSMQQ